VDTNFTRGAPYKIWEGKNVQNSVRFLTTVNFDHKYLRNKSTYRKSEKYLINYISSPTGRNKFGELWSTNNKVIDAHVDPPNWTFFGRLYFGPYGALAPQIFTRARLDTGQGLLAHTTNRVVGPPKNLRANI